MIIIGEKLNSSIPKTLSAIENHDTEYILSLIKMQSDFGADYLDVNTALTLSKETENMFWIIDLLLNNSDCGIMIDSPNPQVIIECLKKTNGRKSIVNSITLTNYNDDLLSAVRYYNAGVVCLPIESKEIPQTAEKRFINTEKMIEILYSHSISDCQIYMDILVEAIATNDKAAITALKYIKIMKEKIPQVNTICGLSNISFGLPKRAKLNASFLTMAIQNGLDSAITDITQGSIRDVFVTSKTLLGDDEYCMEYINAFR